ncbi:MAG: DUF2892 domain-containing protein [bacterium]
MIKVFGIALDRLIRGFVGVLLVIVGFLNHSSEHVFFLTIGAVMIITAITGACAFGTSCEVKSVKVKIKEEEIK